MRRRVTLGIIMTLVFTPLFGWGGTMTANEKGSNAGETVTASGLKYVDQAVGTGDAAVAGKTVSVPLHGLAGEWKEIRQFRGSWPALFVSSRGGAGHQGVGRRGARHESRRQNAS